jgi:hypothetical protein
MKTTATENPTSPIIPQSPREALFLQFAQAYYQDMAAVGNNAPFGQVLNHVDTFAFEKTRELGRKSLELVLEDQIEKAEKKKKHKAASAKNVKRKNDIEDALAKKSPSPKAR